jgi:hypothetical protein
MLKGVMRGADSCEGTPEDKDSFGAHIE